MPTVWMSRNTGKGDDVAQKIIYNYHRVILASNVEIGNVGEYFVKGMVVDDRNEKNNVIEGDCIFSAEKFKMAEREMLVGDCLGRISGGYMMIRVCILQGGSKTLHAGTTLGYVEE